MAASGLSPTKVQVGQPRTLCLQRSDHGFGFTLRHFIVYPPESYTMAGPPQAMDTIFVKHVHENSPAFHAGLTTGDRIVSVNNQNITSHTYAQVVQLIQSSGLQLYLTVVPKEHDILQLYFGATAHNPSTNERPRFKCNNNTSDLDLSNGSSSTEDSMIISRIRKSCEQKEEFLRRPNPPLLREFYARPQKLNPVWPPKPSLEPITQPGEINARVVPRVELNPNLVNTYPSVKVPPRVESKLHLVDSVPNNQGGQPNLSVGRRARLFENGDCDRTLLYKSELSRLSTKRVNPNVAIRKKEIEDRTRTSSLGTDDRSRTISLELEDKIRTSYVAEEERTRTSSLGRQESYLNALDASSQVVRRHKPAPVEDDRLRRTSYLRATHSDHMNADSDHEYSDSELQTRSANRKWRPQEQVDIQQLCDYFEEGAHKLESWLQCKLIMIDNKRCSDRSWKLMNVILSNHNLTLVKDEDKQCIDVSCCQVEVPGTSTKRKHCLRITTLVGFEVLIQAEDVKDLARWMTALQEQTTSQGKLSPSTKGLRKLTWKGRVARQFRRIQASASSPMNPPEGSTIGVPLEDCPASEVNDLVPMLIVKCTSIVEEKGLDVIGIYRVPGNTAAVSSLTEAVNKGFQFITYQDVRWSDVNVISSLLKLFFRRLPDALLTSELYPHFIESDKLEDANQRITSLKRLVHLLPDCHYETLKYLCLHLKKVTENSCLNKMEPRNLAIVFGPTLVRQQDCDMMALVNDMSSQCRIVESLLLYTGWFFEEEGGANFPFPANQELAEASNMNHDLLLNNIRKVEGMKSKATIGASIISAANRKLQKVKAKKQTDGVKEQAEGVKDVPEGVEALSDVIKGKIAVERDQLEEVKEPAQELIEEPKERDSFTYAGLHATTKERIRKFELETLAMLERKSRDSSQDEDCLLSSLTSTFDLKMKSLLSSTQDSSTMVDTTSSLVNVSSTLDDTTSTPSTFVDTSYTLDDSLIEVPAPVIDTSTALIDSFGKQKKVERCESMSKTEKTSANVRRKEKREELKRKKDGMPQRNAIKRRHTVGGTKDFDKTDWLDNRLREQESSPDLSSSRLRLSDNFLVEIKFLRSPLESNV